MSMNTAAFESRQALHKFLALRLGLIAVVFGLITSASLWFYGIELLEHDAVEKAQEVAQELISEHRTTLEMLDQSRQTPEQSQKTLLDWSNQQIDQTFTFIEIYNAAGEEIVVAQSSDPFARHLAESREHLNPKVEAQYKPHFEKNTLFVQTFTPLELGQDNRIIGYLELMYTYPPQLLKRQHEYLIEAVIAVVISILLTALVLYPILLRLINVVNQQKHAILKGNLEMMTLLGSAISKRDSDTDAHNFRVTLYAIALAESVDLPLNERQALLKGAFVHDIGKIAISDTILLKPGPLNDEEFSIMKTHVSEGLDIIHSASWLQEGRDVVAFHHEKVDGSGYPNGLARNHIPINARIFALADVFDALTSKRPYKEPMPLQKALTILREGRGNHFDPALTDAFLQLAPDLYRNYYGLARRELEQRLNHIVKRYFL
ncbi:MAG: HD-GYP domain-containing protein [Hydrogenovibrio sp.]|uniref:HD-GYP domain-containing protein n=1 Tax=Hydrogenovibrio sp. TaxID=2065821 RepID=UPI00286FD03C|nr:HD-GYP domain-containing protein [Hydrogenovibrio sp.]MDR9499043.1 HD-GYP domain-containing protein [Hydrogenovibrio sp.]